jgi:hypothetical protein
MSHLYGGRGGAEREGLNFKVLGGLDELTRGWDDANIHAP